MTFKILIVDDSNLFSRHMEEILNADPMIDVVGIAKNGQEAIEKVAQLSPDAVTMDVEMPIMDGISAVKAIMEQNPVPILMFSALTYSGAQASLEALEAGALDILPKRFEEITSNRSDAINTLRSRVKQLAQQKAAIASKSHPAIVKKQYDLGSIFRFDKPTRKAEKKVSTSDNFTQRAYKIILIGASTGGPVALQKILSEVPKNFSLPILLVQHMPATFTQAFAERLNTCCEIEVKEAQDMDELIAGRAYLAPGGKQMIVEADGEKSRLRVMSGDKFSVPFKPCVDVTFESVINYSGAQTLAVILTGMGTDGQLSCQKLKDKGATIWAQDEATSVVYGMPQAVVKANLAEAILPLQDITPSLLKVVKTQ